MIRILLLLSLLIPSASWSATITAANGGGNWSATTTWVGGVVPEPGTDTVIIPATLTAPLVLNDTRTIPATTVEDEVYGLVQGPGVVTTLGGALTIGNGTGKDGKFTFGAGSELAQGTNNVILGNCIITSAATTGSWAKVTGSGNWQTHGTVTGPMQDLQPRYVSWQNTGTLTFAYKPTGTGSVTNRADFQHIVFYGTGAIQFGLAASGATDATRIFKYIDFRNLTGGLSFNGLAGTPTVQAVFEHNTVSNTVVQDWRINQLHGWSIKGNVFDRFTYGTISSGTSGAHIYEGNFFTASGANVTQFATLNDNYAAQTFTNNFLYADFYNPHYISSTGSGGSGTKQYTNNFFDEDEAVTLEGNAFIPGALAQNITGNIYRGSGTIHALAGAVTGAGVTGKNNTVYVTDNRGDAWGHTWLLESTASYSGQVKISSNLVAYKPGVSPQSSSYFAANNTATIPQTIFYSDYNAYPSTITLPYKQLTVTNTGNDIATMSNPGFVDPDRNLAKWGQTILGTDGTVAAAKAKLLAINGYNSTTKTQSDAPSGTVIYGTDTALVNWVRAGFAPTNPILKTSGEGGAYIGAIDVVTLGNPAALLMVQ